MLNKDRIEIIARAMQNHPITLVVRIEQLA